MFALLGKSLYGTGDAAFNWTHAYTTALESLSFVKAASSHCSFRHEDRRVNLVRGDDFLSEGEAQELRWFDIEPRKHFELKTEVLGPDAKNGEVQEIRLLNIIMTWPYKRIVWEADPRHAELLVEQLGLQGVKESCSPGIKDEVKPRTKKEDGGDDGGDV